MAANGQDSRIEIGDTVVLQANSALVGVVACTHYNYETQQPNIDALFLLHTYVPEHVLDDFLAVGVPPRGYLLVQWADEENGSSLVPEDGVTLLDRGFVIGDTVKRVDRDDATVGTVISIEDSYVIEPMCRPWPGFHTFRFTFVDNDSPSPTPCGPTCHPTWPSQISHKRPHDLLYDIPGSELKRSHDYTEGDYIIFHDWLGYVAAVDIDVALLLEDKAIVWVEKPWELHYLIANNGTGVVVSPERFESTRPPEIDLVKYRAVGVLPPEEISCGQFVVTNRKNLKNGRWLQGKYNHSAEPVGHVLDVRTRRLEVQWLCPNPYAFDLPLKGSVQPPPASIRPYENLSSFRNPRDIRRSKELVSFDHDRPMSRTSLPENTIIDPWNQDSESKKYRSVSTGRDLRVGDRVRWLDTTAAKLKYQATSQSGHGCFRPVPRDETHDFDLNEFKVISTRHHVKVLWQNQTTSKHDSTALRMNIPLEPQLFPGDIVTAREGIKMARYHDSEKVVSEFNEMQAFEQNFTLEPERVGVVQTVDPQDQVAHVKWFGKPRIAIMNADTALSADSKLGDISNSSQDVSLYEVMSHQVFDCRRGDIVIIPGPDPNSIQKKIECFRNLSITNQNTDVPRLLSQISEGPGETLVTRLQRIVYAPPKVATNSTVVSSLATLEETNSNSTWIGEVMDVHLNGHVTVRLLAAKQCLDVEVHRDDIVLTIDVAAETDGAGFLEAMEAMEAWGPTDAMDLDDSDEPPSPIDEEIEYDGGDRMDDESDDQGWITDEETVSSAPGASTLSKDLDMDSTKHGDQNAQKHTSTTPKQGTESTVVEAQERSEGKLAERKPVLQPHSSQSAPASFEILSSTPPPDQFRASQPSSAAPSLLKRLSREHRILASSLPANEIYVRTYESRLDLMRCLIIGPKDTPYEYAPFIIDLHLGSKYPKEPPTAHFHSWTHGLGRINPNLYEEGKICLSLLGTWQGKNDTETWSEDATILQILVSLQGLVFVKEPYYNEAGFETMQEARANLPEAMQYSEKAFVIARGFIKYALRSPVQSLEEVLAWLYLSHAQSGQKDHQRNYLRKVVQRADQLIRSSESHGRDASGVLFDGRGDSRLKEKAFLRPLSKGAIVMLRRNICELEEMLKTLEAQQADAVSSLDG